MEEETKNENEILENENENSEKKYERNEDGTFKKGSGGRRGGKKNYETYMWEAMQEIAVSKGSTKEQVFKDVTKAGILFALKGKYPFYQDVFDRFFGKPLQTIKNEFDDDVERIRVEIINNKDDIRNTSNEDIPTDSTE